MTFTAILFDLFDTLVIFDRTRLPLVALGGRQFHSSIGCLYEVLRPHAPDVTLEACHQGLTASWRDAEQVRAEQHREVPAPERFGRWLRGLAIDPASCTPELITTLLETHRREMTKAAEFPAHHGPLLRRLAERFRLAVVSNFDYSPTAIGILETAGVAPLFEAIVVSDQVGWRKPRREIFDAAFRRLAIAPHEALFVGDRADLDVLGAHEAGMAVAWINRNAEPLPAGIAPPTFEIRDLAELLPILGLEPR